MYQFYYAEKTEKKPALYQKKLSEAFLVEAIRPAMWEEHCLECSAPLCYRTCPHYVPRTDGRCKRFDNSYELAENPLGCCGQSVRVKFRTWANMMTIVFPAMLRQEDAQALTDSNQKLGRRLRGIAHSHLPAAVKWECIRTLEFLRRRKLRALSGRSNQPDAFVFHGYSFEPQPYHLIVEMYEEHTPVFKTSLLLKPGENLIVLDKTALDVSCWTDNNLVKIYPENNLEAELDILWCDFVQGRAISEEKADKVKCIVWDLDNTVWDGVLIETEDPAMLRLRPQVLETIKQLDERGMIQSVASKNDYDLAWPVVERLGIAEYFLYPQIHWNAKSSSIEQIARSLNIGIDAMALIDDSAFEKNQVKSAFPQVRVYDADEVPELLDKAELTVPVTEEGRNRRAMYRAEEKRNQIKSEQDTDLTFLRKCNLRIELYEPNTGAEIARCYELTVRTNQLNLSGRKYSRQEFAEVLKRPNHRNFAFSCEDNFGAYGIVGFGQYRMENSVMFFTEFAMSCRVAGKYVESALFCALLEQENCQKGVFTVQKTKKNVLLRRTLEQIGFTISKQDDGSVAYEFGSELKNSCIVGVNRSR